MTATEAVAAARRASRLRAWVLIGVAVAGSVVAASGLIALAVVIHQVSVRAERVAEAAAYQQWTDCVEDLTDAQEALFEERIGDLFGAALVRNDDLEAIRIADEIDGFDLTPDPDEITLECGQRPKKPGVE